MKAGHEIISGIINTLHTLTPTLPKALPLTAPHRVQLANRQSYSQILLSVDSPAAAISDAPGLR
jgi:hypothetical protein